ncbi:trehalose-phosphatase [Xanthobacter autotrophicus]|uniref:trehalose-phosphatase n=1 Tax=Xanthobacter autotrophicus TaxID=280 RepID=UPI001E559B3B|nr:trehalose-phosphatase [Xanthobacter autotrophicus]UDQ91846.1 trehalose-phosphatase [Xanthobacter autotrophicus]
MPKASFPVADSEIPGAFVALDPSTHAFFLDVDGTLIDIAARPEAVVVPPGLPDALATLADRAQGALALVSGRSLASLDELFGAGRFAAAGVHGADIRLAPGLSSQRAARLDEDLRRELRATASEFSGVLAEDKECAVAIHYRTHPEIAPILNRAITEVVGQRPGVEIMPGHCVFEVRRKGIDKGAAVDRFMAAPPFAGRRPVFIGDDVTDEAGFRAVNQAGGIAVAVGTPRDGAQALLPDPRSVRALITHLAAEPRQRRR